VICEILTFNYTKCVWRPGSARTHWGAYSVPPDPLAGFYGYGQGKKKGREEGKEEGRKVRGKGKGRTRDGTTPNKKLVAELNTRRVWRCPHP